MQPGYDTAQFELPVLRNFRQPGRDDELGTLDLIADLTPLTEQAAAAGATLVVWPEATGWTDPFATESTQRALRELVARTGTTLVVPYFLRARAHGATVIVSRDGTMNASATKAANDVVSRREERQPGRAGTGHGRRATDRHDAGRR